MKKNDIDSEQLQNDGNTIVLVFAALFSFGLVAYCLWAWCAATPSAPVLSLVGSGVLIASASLMPGALIGFLFGIPRTLQRGENNLADETRQLVNTNLERISDWLTTLLIGATLVQLVKLPDALWSAARSLAYPDTDIPSGAQTVIFCVILYFATVGFLVGYLVTRLYLTPAFGRAIRVSERVSEQARAVLEAAIRPNAFASPDPEAKKVAQETVNRSLESLKADGDIIAWARAQQVLDNHAEASRAYQILVQRHPEDIDLRREYSFELQRAGLPDIAERVLREGQNIEDERSKRQRISLILSRSLSKLYQPGRYQEVIDELERIKEEGVPESEIYVLLAAANGQKHEALVSSSTTADEINEARNAALQAAKTAIALQPSAKNRLRWIWDPKYPNKDPVENDLESLFTDREFQDLMMK